MLNFVKNVASAFYISTDQTHIGAVTFGNQGYNEFYLNEYVDKNELVNRINQIGYRGENTNTSGGIYTAMKNQFHAEKGDRSNVANVMVVITDGVSTRDNHLTVPYSREAENMGILVFGIGVTENINEEEVKMISSYPHEKDKNYFLIPKFTNLNEFIDRVKETVCSETSGTTSRPTNQPSTTPHPCPENREYGCWARQIMNRTLAEAALKAGLAKSEQMNLKMNVAVVDVGANLVTFTRMDDAWLGSVDIAIKKAKTAVFFNMRTGDLGRNSQPGGSLYNIEHSNNGLITFPGGVPVYDRTGCLIGAVGVSGDTVENDEIVANAGVQAIRT